MQFKKLCKQKNAEAEQRNGEIMNKTSIIKLVVILLAIVAVVVSAVCVKTNIETIPCEVCEGAGCGDCSETGQVAVPSNYYATFVSLLPPILAILLALVTKEVYSSLFIGIVLAALFSSNFSPVPAMNTLLETGLIGAVSGTAGIFVFLVVLGILVAMVNKAGGSAASTIPINNEE